MNVAKHYPMTKPHPDKEPSWFLVILISGILSGVLLFVIGWYMSLPDAQKALVFKKLASAGELFPGIIGLNQPKVLLVMGVDMPPPGSHEEYSYVRTDTMMLVKLDTSCKKVNVVSIPRDSRVFIARNHGTDKINAAFTLGGADLAVETVEQTFNVNVDNYLVLNIRGVREFVDALGGVDIFVEKPMRYRDRTAGLNINLQPGSQHLDGKEAEGFLRFRHDALGDIGRIRRQQQFVAAVASEIKNPDILLKIKPLVSASNKYVLTDLSTPDLISIMLFAQDLDHAAFEVATLPGHPSFHSQVSYWIIDSEPAEEVLNRLIVGIAGEESPLERPTVGILYTGNHSSEINRYKMQLESSGFDVACQLQLRRTTTRLVTHSSRFGKESENKLKQSNTALQDAQLIFSPHGATFETNSCGRTDFTIILGEDTRSAVNQ